MILVVGGTGTLGRALVPLLVAQGRAVRVLSRGTLPPLPPPVPATTREGSVTQVHGDLRDTASLVSAFEGVDLVVAAAHGFTSSDRGGVAAVDREGNRHLVDLAGERGAEVVLMSVAGASPTSPMELFRSKWEAEQHLRAGTAPGTVVRSTAFVEVWAGLLEQTAGRSGRPLVFGRGRNPMNFVSVLDVAALVAGLVGDPAARGGTLEIGGARNLTMNELAALVQQVHGWSGSPRHVPRPALRGIAGLLPRVRPLLARQAASGLAMDTIDLRYSPTPDATHRVGPTDVADALRLHASGGLNRVG